MKKLIFFIVTAIMLAGCSIFRMVDISNVTTGMTKAQVRNMLGAPDRVLYAAETGNGFQEVLQYKVSGGDVYALQFVNDYLTGYEFLYEDGTYVAPPPPVILPQPGYPIYTPSPSPEPKPTPPESTSPERPEPPPGYSKGPATQPSQPSSPENKPEARPAENPEQSKPSARSTRTRESGNTKR